MKFRRIAAVVVVILVAVGLASAKDSPEKKKEKTRKMATQTLNDLYKREPTARAAIQKSAGYAVFNNMGTNLLLLSTARGAGMAVNSKTKQETFMKMISAGAGLGLGVKDYRVIFVFENDNALSHFLDSGWSGSAQTDAAAKVGEKGGAYSGAVEVAPGVWVYQITKNGVALQLTLQGTKYYKDDDLNKSALRKLRPKCVTAFFGLVPSLTQHLYYTSKCPGRGEQTAQTCAMTRSRQS
jgi:lipid-binding SYLF domain-containing protein